MTNASITPSLQDFRLISTHVEKIQEELGFRLPTMGFYFFALDLLLNLQDDEIEDAITDSSYLNEQTGNKGKGHDRGIDVVYIDEEQTPAVIHIYNFKYTEKFENTTNNFPSNELDKILGFLGELIQADKELLNTVNPVLGSKVREIWDLFKQENPKFRIHLCSNLYLGLEQEEKKRFEKSLDKYTDIEPKYHLMHDFVSRLTQKGKKIVNARFHAVGDKMFERSDGDIRALIVNMDVRDLLRIVSNDEKIRDNVEISDYSELTTLGILEDAFEDNVRVYLRQRSRINRNIKDTALSEDSHRFFYYNNGITITCSKFSFPAKRMVAIVNLENLQIVNGSQTIHALYEAFLEDQTPFENMDILCRIYETANEKLSTEIAEYTNSQNPVGSRDIRSNDFTQKKLESELKVKGFYYERKKGQYSGQSKDKRIDALKTGQALMAFFNLMPAEAKDKKRIIFAEKYEDVFTDEISADPVLLSVNVFRFVEEKKLERKKEIALDETLFELDSFILHATYYMMYVISVLADIRGIEKTYSNYSEIIALYDEALSLIRKAVINEKNQDKDKDIYTHRKFFKGNRPKMYIEKLLPEK